MSTVNGNGTPLVRPSDGLIQELMETAETQSGRAYRRIMKQTDWYLANADQLDKAISASLAFVDLQQAEHLSKIGLERFPKNNVFIRIQPLFSPAPARVVKRRWEPNTPGALQASAKWIREHNDEYEIGHWLAVKDGELIADAPTLKEFDELIESLGGEEILARNTIVHKVIS
ncbi:MAG: hypothetical protein AAF639_33360 [Chloroflexota bacterium]